MRPFRHLRSTVQSTRAPMFLLLTWHPNTSKLEHDLDGLREECKLRVGAPAGDSHEKRILDMYPPPSRATDQLPLPKSNFRNWVSIWLRFPSTGCVWVMPPNPTGWAYLSQMDTQYFRIGDQPPGTHLAAVRRRPHKCSSARASCKIQRGA